MKALLKKQRKRIKKELFFPMTDSWKNIASDLNVHNIAI